jgi:hypothetical protein
VLGPPRNAQPEPVHLALERRFALSGARPEPDGWKTDGLIEAIGIRH